MDRFDLRQECPAQPSRPGRITFAKQGEKPELGYLIEVEPSLPTTAFGSHRARSGPNNVHSPPD